MYAYIQNRRQPIVFPPHTLTLFLRVVRNNIPKIHVTCKLYIATS